LLFPIFYGKKTLLSSTTDFENQVFKSLSLGLGSLLGRKENNGTKKISKQSEPGKGLGGGKGNDPRLAL